MTYWLLLRAARAQRSHLRSSPLGSANFRILVPFISKCVLLAPRKATVLEKNGAGMGAFPLLTPKST